MTRSEFQKWWEKNKHKVSCDVRDARLIWTSAMERSRYLQNQKEIEKLYKK